MRVANRASDTPERAVCLSRVRGAPILWTIRGRVEPALCLRQDRTFSLLAAHSNTDHENNHEQPKMPVATRTPISIDYANYYSLESKNRQRSKLKEIKPFSEMPGMINVSAETSLRAS
jgi:aromatic amino acid aminotransferase I